MTILGTISAILLAALPCIAAQDSARRTHAQDFSTQGLDSDGRLIWQLSGESADFRGSVTDLKDANARIVNLKNIETVIHTTAGKKFTLTSTSCQVLLALGELKSDSAIEFTSEGIKGTGIGYDIDLEHKVVRLRTTVRFVIKQSEGRRILSNADGFTKRDRKDEKNDD